MPKRLAKAYEQAIGEVIGQALPPKLPSESFEDWVARVSALSLQPHITQASELLAQRMVNWVDAVNAKTWRQAANKSQRGNYLYSLLRKELQSAAGSRVTKLVRENSRLISSVPRKAAAALASEIAKAQQSGSRPETIAKMARTRFPELLKSRVNLIARTESAKASTVLTQARCETLNIQFYIWETSRDGERVRLSHRKMQGVVVPWSHPPAPEALVGERSTLGHYHAGECPNCRCTQVVVLTVNDIQFPARVYWQGTVRRMNKGQFQKLFNLEERRAA